jgi:hypothetical protein
MDSTGWARVAAALHDLSFPATRQQIVDHALDQRADHGVLRLIRDLPIETYPDLATVCSTVASSTGALAGLERRTDKHDTGAHRTDT